MLLQWLTFASATLAARSQGWLYDQRDRREARRAELAGWSQTGVDTWVATLAALAGPPQRTATVTVTVCGRDGEPDHDQAARLRRYLEDHAYLSRNPTPAELEEAAKDGRRLAIRRARRDRLVT